ncbi:MAG TPA: hypothetical protein VGR48_19745, partial [Terriglobales bacterium]|nr:hypothetical protein [Terriglobales bacterium]
MINLGLDVGAVSLKLAAVCEPNPVQVFARLAAKHDSFFLAAAPNGSPMSGVSFLLSRSRPVHGNPLQEALRLLEEFLAGVPENTVAGVRVTGLGARLIAQALNTEFENEFRAVAKGVRALYPE